MSNRPPINWSAALRDLTADRLARQPVREERLRTAQGLRGAPALALSAWRGQSGRRYVVGVHRIEAFDVTEADNAVALFVARDVAGIASIVCGGRELGAHDVAHLIERGQSLGCTEVHIHRLADNADERAAILADLAAPVLEAA